MKSRLFGDVETHKRMLIGFEYKNGRFESTLAIPFKPEGLMLWHVDDDVMLTMSTIGNELQVLASYQPIPAKFFTTGKSFEDIAKLLEEGSKVPSWVTWSAVYPSDLIRLHFSGSNIEKIQAAMFGVGIYKNV